MSLPAIVVTGTSGFVGRHVVEHLRDDFRIFGIARRSQRRAGVAEHPNVTWLEADIAERVNTARTRVPSEQPARDRRIDPHLLIDVVGHPGPFERTLSGHPAERVYCRDLAVRRFHEGFSAEEFCGAVEMLNLICMRILRRDPASEGMRQQLLDYLTMTLRYGCDQAQETFEELSMRGDTCPLRPDSISLLSTTGTSSARSG